MLRRLVPPIGLALWSLACARLDDQGVGKGSAVPRGSASAAARPEITQALETLRREETELRARTTFERLPPSSRSLGANPYAVVALPSVKGQSGPLVAGVTRGDSELVVLDRNASVLARAPAPLSPTAVAAFPDGRLFVVGEIEPRLARYRFSGSRLVVEGDLPLPEARSLRALAADRRALFVADFWGDRLYSLAAAEAPAVPRSLPLCGGPIRLALSERFLAAVCLFDHAVVVFERDAQGLAAREIGRVKHDGPIWGTALLERDDELLLAAGGVEDHPLDRRDKAFGYVDSFVFLYRLAANRRFERVAAVNTSELGVVTPKLVHLAAAAGKLRLTALGYASERAIELEWSDPPSGEPRLVATPPALPGCSDVAALGDRLLCANPLLDAWVELHEAAGTAGAPVVHPVRPAALSDPSPAERLGEALFFTALMAPDATSAGRRSRFTCETCHFEGGTDGRVHHSGREDIRVSTRPLLGLFNDAPHFSRAKDRDLTSVSHNEFGVANRGNPIDPWFSLSKSRFPWLVELGVTAEVVEPLELRRSLLVFLARFSHAENPLAVRRASPRRFGDDERRGAEIFRERCASCHAARLIARDPTKAVPFERWEELVLSPEGPIVWSNGDYAKTGVTPYVDPMGTRTPSLRRLYLKRPYLTNGSARTLEELLAAVRFSDSEFRHAAGVTLPAGRELGAGERRSLLAFLELL